MNSDNYKIVISISHHRIAFEYWQRDGENRLMPISNIAWPVPLAFYCSPMGIEIGEVAVRAANTGTSNAFDDYFEKLASDETYILGGRRQALRYLLLDAAESVFADFFKNDLYGSQGSLQDNRAMMPVTLACEADIRPNERALVATLFRESGYNRFKVTEYNDFIERYVKESLAQRYPCRNVLVAWTEGSDLSLTLFDMRGSSERRQITLPGLGADPRLKYVKDLIWDRVKGQNSWLVRDMEDEAIERAAVDFLASDIPLLKDTITLSGGISYHYDLNRAVIDNLQCDEGAEIKAKLDEFLRQNGISDKADTLLILRGMASGNLFFEQTLCPGFREVIRSDRKLRENVMQLLIADPNPVVIVEKPTYTRTEAIPANPEPAKPKSVRPLTSDSGDDRSEKSIKDDKKKAKSSDDNPKSQGGFMSGLVSSLGEGFTANAKEFGDTMKGVISSGIGIVGKAAEGASEFMVKMIGTLNPEDLKKLQREWRETKALAKGKVRADKNGEARSMLEEFIQKCRQLKAEDLANEATEMLETMPEAKPQAEANARPARNKTSQSESVENESNPVETARSRRSASGGRVTPPAMPKESGKAMDEGRKLAGKGKLKEAREWYREQGDKQMASLVGDVIRKQKSADTRLGEAQIESFRKSADAAKVKRVVDELEEFIAKAEKIGLNTSDYKRALLQYRKMR